MRYPLFITAALGCLVGAGCGAYVPRPLDYTPNPDAHPGITVAASRELLGALSVQGRAVIDKWDGPVMAAGDASIDPQEGSFVVHVAFPGSASVKTPCDFLFEVPNAPSEWKLTYNQLPNYMVTIPYNHYRVLQGCESMLTPNIATLTLLFSSEQELQRFLDVAAALPAGS